MLMFVIRKKYYRFCVRLFTFIGVELINKMNRVLKFAITIHNRQSFFHKVCLPNINSNVRTIYSCNVDFQKQPQRISGDGLQPKKKTKPIPKITLIGQNQAITITSLEEAQKLAKRRDLQLIKVQQMDSKTHRPVYKLLKAADILSEEMQELQVSDKSKDTSQDTLKKSEKSLTIGARISENDLSSRLKNISKWLVKNHEVRILIQGNQNETTLCEKIFQTIEKFLKEPEVIGKVVNKRTKGSNVKFNIIPVLKPTTEDGIGDDKKQVPSLTNDQQHV